MSLYEFVRVRVRTCRILNTKDGENALMYVGRQGSSDIAKVLMTSGIDVNLKNKVPFI
jgi:hypothetical protein